MKRLMTLALTVGIAAGLAAGPTHTVPGSDAEIAAKAAKEVRLYTRYTIWDNIHLAVREGALELNGQVSQPFKKKDLERLMVRVPGVTSVTNNLEVLPVSFYDDDIRIRVARAIYRDPVFNRYAIQAVPPVHIIVNRGQVTLEGVVNSELEKTVATMRASTAGLSLGPVVNNLRVENPKAKS